MGNRFDVDVEGGDAGVGTLIERGHDEIVDLREASDRASIVIFAPSGLVGDAFARVLSIAGYPARIVDASARRLPEGWWRGCETVIAFDALVDALPDELRGGRRDMPNLVLLGERPQHVRATSVGSNATCQGLIEALASLSPSFTEATRQRQILTRRHTEILQLVANGHTTEEVGERLGIAPKTVNNHLSSVYKRLGARNLTRAVLIAARWGLVDVTVSSVFVGTHS